MICYVRAIAIVALFSTSALALMPSGAKAEEAVQPQITARNAIVIDATSGQILYDKASTDRVALASLTKLFTAFVAIESTPLSQKMEITNNDLIGESSAGVSAGEVLSFEELLYGMLLASGNDAAMAIARNIGGADNLRPDQAVRRFLDQANERLAELGLSNTRLENPHGLDQPGHYSSARDIAALTRFAMHNEPAFTTVIGTAQLTTGSHTWINTNQLPQIYDGVVGGKTGTTEFAGKCLVEIVTRNGHTLITVLLGSTEEQWYADAVALLDHGFDTVGGEASLPYGRVVLAEEIVIPRIVPNEPSTDHTVIQTEKSVSVLRPSAAYTSDLWAAWKWPLIAVLASVVFLVTFGQAKSGERMMQQRFSRQRYARPMHRRRSRRTQPVNTRIQAGSWGD